MIPPVDARLRGTVTSYDDHAGFGEIEGDADADAVRYWFHCTHVADGSRHADPGQQVSFRVVPGHCGRWEASEIG